MSHNVEGERGGPGATFNWPQLCKYTFRCVWALSSNGCSRSLKETQLRLGPPCGLHLSSVNPTGNTRKLVNTHLLGLQHHGNVVLALWSLWSSSDNTLGEGAGPVTVGGELRWHPQSSGSKRGEISALTPCCVWPDYVPIRLRSARCPCWTGS